MRIAGRLLLLLALPLIGLLSLTGFGVYSGAEDWRGASALQDRTALSLTSFELANELQAQRASLIESGGVNPESLARVERLRHEIASAQATMPPGVRRSASTTLAWIDGSQRVAERGLSDTAALDALSPAINSVLSLASAMIDPKGSVESGPASTVENLARTRAASAEEYDRLRVIARSKHVTAEQFQVLTGLSASQQSYLGLAAATAPTDLAVRIERVGHGITGADRVRRATFETGDPANFDLWQAGIRSRNDELAVLRPEAEAAAVAAVDRFAESSRVLLVLATTVAALTIIITVFLLRRALSSIAKPLETLASQAEEIATVRLPEAVRAQQEETRGNGGSDGEVSRVRSLPQVEVRGAAEVAEVAAAFNDVQETAVRLAGEQAALRVNQAEALTNLGRRNQTLLARQLNYLSSLESDETDPTFLEHLFKLDHLASRMRRNAESLLILAGSESPRIRRKPANVTEVIRAAMSEVEDFERIRIGNLREDVLVGPVVIDVIHLLAELIENALSFSPPESTVVIEGGPLGQGGYQFAVIDQGVGMAEVELAAANKRLAGLDELEGVPTRYLGQYVVAKLARKTGTLVMLRPTVGGRGVSALVTLPSSAMLDDSSRSINVGPRPGSRKSRSVMPEPFAPGAGVPVAGAVIPKDESVTPDLRDTGRAASLQAEVTSVPRMPEDPPTPEIDETVEVAEPVEALNELSDQARPAVLDEVPASSPGATPELLPRRSPDGVADSEIDRVFGSDTEPIGQDDQPNRPWWTEPLRKPAGPPVRRPVAQPEVPRESENTGSPVVITAEAETVLGVRDADVKFAPSSEADRTARSAVGASSSLRRRVPGASLANRTSDSSEDVEALPERSAEQVRSRLASFQAGRSRGLGEQTPAGSDSHSPDSQGFERAQDRRSTQ